MTITEFIEYLITLPQDTKVLVYNSLFGEYYSEKEEILQLGLHYDESSKELHIG